MQALDPLDRWGQSDEPHTPRTTLCLKMQHPSHPDYEDTDKRFCWFGTAWNIPMNSPTNYRFPASVMTCRGKELQNLGQPSVLLFFCFFLEIIYNKSHPSSLTKKQGALNGWHVLKLTSLVLNVLAVLKKFKQKIKCYLIHTLFITLTSTLSDNVLKSAWNVIDLPCRITFNKNLITRFLVETADFSLVTYAWLL